MEKVDVEKIGVNKRAVILTLGEVEWGRSLYFGFAFSSAETSFEKNSSKTWRIFQR